MKKQAIKNSLSGLLALAMLLALAACGQQSQQTQTPSQSQETQAPDDSQETQTPESSQTEDGDISEEPESGKALVVYYSATGSTEAVAGYIADALGADTFEIIPAEPYTSEDLNWTNADSRVSREHDDESLRDVPLTTATVENWADYDTVFIGYPIWWGIAAWPTDSFVGANDFTGKTVIPFCTSTSSGLGESGELLAELAGTGEWLEGQRFRSSGSQADVTDWVNGLGLNG